MHLTDGSETDLYDGVVSGHRIGVCLEIVDYDTNRLTVEVRFEGNEVNLQATELPVPEASAPFADP